MKNSADSNYKLSLSDDCPQMIQVVYSSLSGSLWILQKIKKKDAKWLKINIFQQQIFNYNLKKRFMSTNICGF